MADTSADDLKPSATPVDAGTAKPMDEEDRLRVLEHLRASQRLLPGIIAGAIAGVICAAVWATIAIFVERESAWIALGVGFLVGLAVRLAGRGFEVRYAAIGGFLALAAIVLGKVLTFCGLIAKEFDISFWEALANFPWEKLPLFLQKNFSAIDILFYALAVWMGWKGARRELDESEIRQAYQQLKSER